MPNADINAPEWWDQDALNASLDLIERAGAHAFEVGYLREDVPTDQADWYAVAEYRGSKVMVEHRAGPVEAAEALARKLLNGGQCAHCGQVVSISGNRPGVCRWTRQADKWVRGCVDTHREGDRRTDLIEEFIEAYGRRR